MAVFNYIAVTETGKSRKGIMEGDSTSQIRQMLSDRGLTPIEITLSSQERASSVEPATGWRYFLERQKRVPVSHVAVITYQFAALLAAGMPVEAALASMAMEMDNATFKRVILGVRGKVMEGHTLASGMADYPHVFPKLYVASVAVGEKTGQLEKVLTRLADYYEKQRQVQEKIMTAMIYPGLLTLVAGSIVVFLLTYVIPQVTAVFIQTGQALPEVTILLLAVSDGLQKYGLYLLILLVALIVIFRFSLRNENFRYRYHLFLLKIPVISGMIIAINAARFSRTFGILFAAGVPVLDAMNSANSIIGLIPMRNAINRAIGQVGEGSSIHQALQKTGYFSSLSNQLIASGEASGELEMMLEKAAVFQEQNTANKLSTALALFEPILILTMGCVVLFIVLAVLLPIFEMNELVK
jgi:general secretion pathway protein F